MHVQNLMNSLWDIRIFLGLVPKESHCTSTAQCGWHYIGVLSQTASLTQLHMTTMRSVYLVRGICWFRETYYCYHYHRKDQILNFRRKESMCNCKMRRFMDDHVCKTRHAISMGKRFQLLIQLAALFESISSEGERCRPDTGHCLAWHWSELGRKGGELRKG